MRTAIGRRLLAGALSGSACLALTACTPDGMAPHAIASDGPAVVRVAIGGSPSVAGAYRAIAAAFTRHHPQIRVEVTGYPTLADEVAATSASAARGLTPDLFLLGSRALAVTRSRGLTQPVDPFLEERQIDFGDTYDRGALEDFSIDGRLTCMPVSRSPLVVYYNRRLVDPTTIARRNHDVITAADGWQWTDFIAALAQAHRRGAVGAVIGPGFDSVLPLLLSAGSSVVDDPGLPTQLELQDPGSATALLDLLLAKRARLLRWGARDGGLAEFAAGRVGMILGYRDLVPTLRAHRGVSFDVLPVPTIAHAATVGETVGICMSAHSHAAEAAADVMTFMVSDPSMTRLAATGAIVPANVTAASSRAFLNAGGRIDSYVFFEQLAAVKNLPSGARWDRVHALADTTISSLFAAPAAPRLRTIETALSTLSRSGSQILSPTPSR